MCQINGKSTWRTSNHFYMSHNSLIRCSGHPALRIHICLITHGCGALQCVYMGEGFVPIPGVAQRPGSPGSQRGRLWCSLLITSADGLGAEQPSSLWVAMETGEKSTIYSGKVQILCSSICNLSRQFGTILIGDV